MSPRILVQDLIHDLENNDSYNALFNNAMHRLLQLVPQPLALVWLVLVPA